MYTFTITKKITIAAAIFSGIAVVQAQQFTVNNVNYEIIDATEKTVKVVYSPDYEEMELEIVPKITNPDDGQDYTVIEIASAAFRGNNYIKDVTIPDTVESIGDYAFENCADLNTLNIDNGVVTIGEWAFANCTYLGKVTIPASVTSIGQGAFAYCSDLYSFTVNSRNTVYAASNGVLFSKDMKTLYRYPSGKAGDTYTIPDGVETIGVAAFEGALLTSIVMPNSVKVLEEAAFLNCGRLQNINLSNTLTTIGAGVFRTCAQLEEVNIPATVSSIGAQAFGFFTEKLRAVNVDDANPYFSSDSGVLYNKDETKLLYYPIARDATDYVVASTVETIEAYAFLYSKLETLELPATLKLINKNAFFQNASLKTIRCAAVEPPKLENATVFSSTETTKIVLKVPVGSAATYKATNIWRNFIIEEDDTLATQNEVFNKIEAKVYPNPTTGIFFVEVENAGVAQIVSISGQAVKTVTLNKGKNQVDISNVASGLYLVKIGDKAFKLLKK